MAASTKTTKKTATKTAKKTEATTEAEVEVNNVIGSAVKTFEEAAVKAQERYLSLLEQGQAAALERYETMIDAVSKVDVPSIPGLDAMKVPADAFDTYFDFAEKLLANQREFTTRLLATTAKS